MAKIYLSSTYDDLKEHREAVYRALRKMRQDVIAMEHYVATDQRPLDKCLEDVCGCDLYIGLFAWRYGYIPFEDNPEQKSITELEYRTAVKQGKPTLLFLLDENALWSPKWMDSQTGEGNAGALILALRQEFLRDKLVSTFQSKEDIANVVIHAVHDWERRRHLNASSDPFLYMRTKYLEQVYRRYSSVKLPIGLPQGLSLHAIFQPLTLRGDPMVVENLTCDKRRPLLGEPFEEYEHEQSGNGLDDIYPTMQNMTAKNAEEALKKSHQQRMVVLGGPGTGKTTTLKYLAARQANEALENPGSPVPIYLSLTTLARSGKSLQRYLVDIVEDMEVDPAYANLLWNDIQHGQAYICLDSLDEVDPKLRSNIIDLINRKAQEPGNIWVVGSRFTEYKGGQFKAGQFSEWEIQLMSATLREELACRLFPELCICLELTHQELPTAQTFVSLLEQHPRASAWGRNPLLLSLAAVVFLRQGSLPASRTLLYQHVIDAVLATREPDPIRQKILLRVLTELALWVHQQRSRTFTTEDLINFFMEEKRRSWGETNDLTHAVINSGIVEIVARQTYGFRHQTFQEYLAASELARRLVGTDISLREEAEAFVWAKRAYSRWTEILRMMVGILVPNYGTIGLRKASQWIEKLAQQHTSEEEDPGFLSYSLALIMVSELGEIPEWHSLQTTKLEISLLETWFDELILAAQRDERSKTERLTSLMSEIIHFQESSIDSIYEKIVATLENKSRSVREMCIEVLGKFGSRAVNIMLHLLRDRTFDSEYVLLRTLKELSEYVPLEPLLAALHHEVISVRSRAVKAIGNLGERAPLEPLLAALHDADDSVRQATVIALGNLGEQTPLEPLLVALYDDSWFVRWAAMRALGNLGERVPLEPLLDALHEPNPDVRREAARALGQRKDVAIEQMLVDEVAGGIRSPYLYRLAIETLGYLREPIPPVFLSNALHDANPFMRQVAVATLGMPDEPTYVEALIEALHDPHSSVRRAAVLTLRNWSAPTSFEQVILEPLLGTLRDADPFVREEAAVTLGELGVHIPLQPLLDTLCDTNSAVRSAALTALGNLSKYIIIPLEPLHNTLRDPASSVRSAAVTALGNLGVNAPPDTLIEALHDTDSSVRSAAIEALGNLNTHAPLDLLLDALHDTDFSMRRAAVTALGNMGKSVPLQPLLDALHHTNPNVQRAAGEALGKIGDCVPLEPLLDALHNADLWTRLPATTALGKLGARAPLQTLLDILYDRFWSMRSRAVEALGNLEDRVSLDPLLEILQDENSLIRRDAIRIIQERKPEALQPLSQEALALLQGDPPGPIFRSIALSFFTNTLGNMGSASSDMLAQLTELLQWPYWQIRVNAASALGKIRRSIPDEAIQQLLVLRRDKDPHNWAVQRAADDALAKILSLETGIEDD